MLSPGHASQSTKGLDAAGHRLPELSYMLSKGELPVIADTQEDREVMKEHLFSINGDVGLPGCVCTVQAEEHNLALEWVNLALADLATTSSTSGC